MANFNSSFWYHLYVNTDKTRSLAATNLYSRNGTMGAVLYNSVATQNSTQRWQWYGINSTTYVLRCEEAGSDAFLGTKYSSHETTPGQTQAVMVRGNVSDDSVYWTVSPWGDGTFFMTNGENGTDWHLEKRGSGSIALSSNVTAPQNGQRWSFAAIEEINDDKYSTISLPSQTTSTPPTNTDPAVPTQSTTTTPAPSGLSIGAKAGIGAGIGLLALIALLSLILFLLRKVKQKQKNKAGLYEAEKKKEIGGEGQEVYSGGKYEMGDEEARHEIAHGESVKDGQRGEDATYEMPATQAPVELPNSTAAAHTQ